MSLGQLSSSQELKGQEGNPRSGCDGDGDRKESGEGFFLVSQMRGASKQTAIQQETL